MTSSSIVPAGNRTLGSGSPVLKREGGQLATQGFASILEGFAGEAPSARMEDSFERHEEPALDESGSDRNPESILAVNYLSPPERQEAAATADLLQSKGTRQPFPGIRGTGLGHGIGPDMHSLLAETALVPEGTQRNAIVAELPDQETMPDEAELRVFQREDEIAEGETPGEDQGLSFMKASCEGEAAFMPAAVADGYMMPEPAPALQILAHLSTILAVAPGPSSALFSAQHGRHFDQSAMPPSELKSLRIRLQPDELGDVEVTLRRVGLETLVTIIVAGRAAAEKLGRDLSLLEDRLGSLLSSGTAQPVTVTLQSQDPGLATDQSASSGVGQHISDEALSGGRGSGRDGRSSPESHSKQLRTAVNERNEENHMARTSGSNSRIV